MKNHNIVFIILLLGALFAIGVNKWMDVATTNISVTNESNGKPQHATASPAAAYNTQRHTPAVGSQPSNTKRKTMPAVANYRQDSRTTPLHITYFQSNPYGTFMQQGSTSGYTMHSSSAATMHSVGGGIGRTNLIVHGSRSNTQATSYNNYGNSIGSIGIYSSTSRLVENNQTTNNSNYSTRAAARRNINYPTYAGNTPQLYDLSSPITYGNTDETGYMNYMSSINKTAAQTTSRKKASTLAEAWIELYQSYHGGDMPSDEELEEFIKWWQGQGYLTPTVDPDPTPTIPGLYDAWLEMFRAELGRDPIDLAELEKYIKWKQGLGPFTPYEELPLGNGIWLLLLLAAAYAAETRRKEQGELE